MCRHCRQKSPPRAVKFDFQCQTFYHDFANSAAYTKPDLICFFNPGLHRHTGYSNYDTWPRTIKAATASKQPIIVTAYTKLEVPLDLERLDQESDRTLTIVQEPTLNRFASQRPERNFISDELSPMIFKNYYYFVVK
jgi:mitochondrial splicing suppressor protein 51